MGAALVGQWDGYSCGPPGNDPCSYADVVGDGDYAYLAHFGQHCVNIIDISVPSNPTWVTDVCADPPNDTGSAQEVRVHTHNLPGGGTAKLLFMNLEFNAQDGLIIVDVDDPTNPIKRTLVTIPSFNDVHTMFYHEGILYLANSNTPQVGIVDLTNYDPDTSPATITTPLWTLNNVGTSFVHEVHVQTVQLPGRGVQRRLYACAWNSGLQVYDVTNVLTQAPSFLGSAPGQSTHSAWATADGKFVVSGEERGAGGIKVWEVSENGGGGLDLTLRDSYVAPSSTAFSVHNQRIVGYRLYNAWYQWGLAAFDIDPATGELALVANYDTFPGAVSGFDGAWTADPFLGPDKVLVGDIEYGLFILNVTGAASIILPNGLPSSAHPFQGTLATVKVIEGGQSVDPESVTLHATVTGQPTDDIVMTPIGADLYEANLPPTPCDAEVDFYFTAQTATLQTVRNPLSPGEMYTLFALTNTCENFRDNFEQNLGWTVGAPGDNASAGIWVRGDPNGTAAQPEDDNPNGTGTMCFFTGQGPVGGGLGAADVDNGHTTLLSPIFDGTGSDTVEYWRWYSNDLGGAPNQDQMFISISNNGGTSWVPLENVTENANAWVQKRFRIADFVTPTANMRLRFVAEDINPGSVVEAAIDDFALLNVVCSDPPGNTTVDNDLDLADYASFDDCMSGPGGGVSEGCCAYDTDVDDDVDMTDYLAIHAAFTGPA